MSVDVTIALFIWGIVISIVFGFGLAYIPILIKHVNEKRKAHKVIFKDSMKFLRAIRKSGKDHLGIFEDEEMIKLLRNPMIPKKLYKEFTNLDGQIYTYNEWLLDSNDIVKPVVKSKIDELNRKWISLVNQLDHDTSLTSYISHLICDDNLTTDATKEFLFSRWGRDYKIDVIDGGSKTVRLKEFVDSEDFYKLIDELKDFYRPSLYMLREARNNLLDTVEDMTKWIRKKLNLKY